MLRNSLHTINAIKFIQELRKSGTKCATNIIIDYKEFENPGVEELNKLFDYISWNPYWDGIWNRVEAERRFEFYFGRSCTQRR